MRARGQAVELRAADLRFTEPEAAQFLNDVMDLRLEAGPFANAAATYATTALGAQAALPRRQDIENLLQPFDR